MTSDFIDTHFEFPDMMNKITIAKCKSILKMLTSKHHLNFTLRSVFMGPDYAYYVRISNGHDRFDQPIRKQNLADIKFIDHASQYGINLLKDGGLKKEAAKWETSI
tara:strand:- start:305 stop:622 length:318 start_codon:yes stop_codon:yes gene_type:complete